MKFQRICSALIASLLLVSNGTAVQSFAEDDIFSDQPVVLAADSDAGSGRLIAAEADVKVETETTKTTEPAETEIQTEPEEETQAEAAEETEETEANQTVSISSVTLTLAESPDTDGLCLREDGTANYLCDGAKLTGMFSVTPDYLMADVNGDELANASDATLIFRVSASSAVSGKSACELLAEQNESIKNSYQAQMIADINQDGSVNSADGTQILVRSAKSGSGVTTQPLGYAVYIADEDGVLQKGWIEFEGRTYYAGDHFSLCSGWNTIDGTAYYFAEDYHLVRNEYVTVDGKNCYINSDAVLLTNGWAEIDGVKHYFDENGMAVKGLQLIDGQYYGFDGNGGAVIGWMRLGGVLRYSDENGVLVSGFRTIDGRQYYFDEAGVVHSGWLQLDGVTRYTNENGRVMTGEQIIDGEVYHFNSEGILYTSGWIEVDGYTRYIDTDGEYLTGIFQIGDSLYAFDTEGNMLTGWIESSGKKYYAMEDGRLARGMFQVNGNTVCFDPDTCEMVTGWYKTSDAKYYFNEDGIMATGYQYIEGQVYEFLADGKLMERHIKICLDAGHAGKHNHSPVNDAYWESDFTWTYHLILADALRSHGIEVITTRNYKDEDPALETRGRTSAGCDLFLSIHSNAAGNTANCNTAADGPLACCNVDGSTNLLGQRLADTVAQVMQTNNPGTIWQRVGDYGLDYYGVLRGAKSVGTPGILLEHSYHTNYRATVWLMDESNLRIMADAEAQVIADYFGLS